MRGSCILHPINPPQFVKLVRFFSRLVQIGRRILRRSSSPIPASPPPIPIPPRVAVEEVAVTYLLTPYPSPTPTIGEAPTPDTITVIGDQEGFIFEDAYYHISNESLTLDQLIEEGEPIPNLVEILIQGAYNNFGSAAHLRAIYGRELIPGTEFTASDIELFATERFEQVVRETGTPPLRYPSSYEETVSFVSSVESHIRRGEESQGQGQEASSSH